jgi:hypothetical protein
MSRKVAVVADLNRVSWPRFPRHAAWLVVALVTLTVCHSEGRAQDATALDQIIDLSGLDTTADDLVRISTTYADTLRDLKIAQLNLETVQRLKPSVVVTNLEVQIAHLNLEAAQRKLQILRMIVEKQLAAAEDKLEILKYLESLGTAPAQGAAVPDRRSYARAQDEATVKILKAILAMR